MKDIKQPINISNYGIALCPNCGADIHNMGKIPRCIVCNQLLDWDCHRKISKDSTKLSGGKLW